MPEIKPLKPELAGIVQQFERQKLRADEQRLAPVSTRKKLLRDLEQFLLRNQKRIMEEIHKDFQKPEVEVQLVELYPVLTEIRHALSNLSDWAKPKKVDAPLTFLGTRSEIRYEPKGVCLIISPWNFPFNLCFGPMISCLAAGNAVILKPSEHTPAASRLIVDLVAEFFTDGLVTTVEGGPEEAGQLLALPFDHIFFTGSPEVGKIVMKAAAQNLTSVTLELGGKSPAIVDRTANISDAAKRVAFGKFLNNGQICIAPDYVLVEESIRVQFVAELKENIVKLYGDNGKLDESSPGYSRIVNKRNYERVTGLIDDAIAQGANVDWRGECNPATRFIHPVILSPGKADMRVMREEIFGPVLPVIPFLSVGEVIDAINGRPKPLALYIFSNDRGFREQVLLRTSAGGVCINDCLLQFSHPDLPFGGVNHSGIGKAHGHYGFLSFSNEKPVLKQRRGITSSFFIQPPYTKWVRKVIDLLVRWA